MKSMLKARTNEHIYEKELVNMKYPRLPEEMNW